MPRSKPKPKIQLVQGFEIRSGNCLYLAPDDPKCYRCGKTYSKSKENLHAEGLERVLRIVVPSSKRLEKLSLAGCVRLHEILGRTRQSGPDPNLMFFGESEGMMTFEHRDFGLLNQWELLGFPRHRCLGVCVPIEKARAFLRKHTVEEIDGLLQRAARKSKTSHLKGGSNV